MGLGVVYTVLDTSVWLLPWVLMASWIIGMADPDGRWGVTRVLAAISNPFLRLVSGMLPRIGMLDISPFLIVILGWIVRMLLRRSFFGF